MFIKNKAFKAFTILVTFLFLLYSCKKNDSSIGLGIQPEDDLLGATYCDTSTIVAYTLYEDSFRTDENSLSITYALLGSINDPVFGRVDASIYTNLVMPNNIIGSGFGINPKLDSVVLSLAYSTSSYGDLSDPLKFNVYKLTDDLNYDSAYYSRRKKAYDHNDITYSGQGVTLVPYVGTAISVLDVPTVPHIRIKLKDEIGQYFMDDTTRVYDTGYLQQAFKGLFITTHNTNTLASGDGNIIFYNMTDGQSKVTIYYHNGTNTTTKALDLAIGPYAARYNYFEHNYPAAANPTLNTQLQGVATGDTILGKQNIFLQGLSGVKARIKIPYLGDFADSGAIAINKAELVFSVDTAAFYGTQTYSYPPRLILDGVNQGNGIEPLIESLDAYAFGGVYNGAGAYSFNIPYTTQKIVSKKYIDYSFYVSVYEQQLYPFISRNLNPGRIILGGNLNPTHPIKLKLWYTKLYHNKK